MRFFVFAGLLWAFVSVGIAVAEEAANPDPLGLANHRGEVVVVDFWASWCKPCRQELPWLAQMAARHQEAGLTVLTVNVDAKRADAEKLLTTLGVTLPVTWDPDGKLAEANHLEGMPTSLVFDRQGQLTSTHVGFRTEDEAAFEAEIVRLLAEGADGAAHR